MIQTRKNRSQQKRELEINYDVDLITNKIDKMEINEYLKYQLKNIFYEFGPNQYDIIKNILDVFNNYFFFTTSSKKKNNIDETIIIESFKILKKNDLSYKFMIIYFKNQDTYEKKIKKEFLDIKEFFVFLNQTDNEESSSQNTSGIINILIRKNDEMFNEDIFIKECIEKKVLQNTEEYKKNLDNSYWKKNNYNLEIKILLIINKQEYICYCPIDVYEGIRDAFKNKITKNMYENNKVSLCKEKLVEIIKQIDLQESEPFLKDNDYIYARLCDETEMNIETKYDFKSIFENIKLCSQKCYDQIFEINKILGQKNSRQLKIKIN